MSVSASDTTNSPFITREQCGSRYAVSCTSELTQQGTSATLEPVKVTAAWLFGLSVNSPMYSNIKY